MNKETTFPKFPATAKSLHIELRNRVNEYFKDRQIPQTGTWKLFLKAALLFILLWAVYFFLLFATAPIWLKLLACFGLGSIISFIGFNIMHDGNHGSFSNKRWLSKMATTTGSMLGASQFMWSIKHNIIHHSFTNVEGVDDDIEIGILMRMAPQQKKMFFHRYQHLYFPFLYMLMYLYWVFVSDYNKYFGRRIGQFPLKKMHFSDHLRFWGVKVFHALVFVVIPIGVVGFGPWLIGFLAINFSAGIILSLVFQLAHTVDGTSFPEAEQPENRLPEEYAVHQLLTTSNFATSNRFVSWFLGGLNFQIEHHLFPKISHIHYPQISSIVRKVCAEYQIPYLEHKTTLQAVFAHIRFLRQLGRA